MNKLVVFGVGLIGGSVALALKKASANVHIVGVGRQQASLDKALALNIIDQAETDIAKALDGADLVLIAAPVAQTAGILKQIQPHMTPDMVITDAGSTKSDVLASAKAVLGAQFNQFVGGHPIAGAEKSGPEAAKADLYRGKNVIVTPTEETIPEAVNVVTALWEACGAEVSTMTPEAHDGIFAAVSHLPHLLAFGLVDDFAKRDDADQLFKYAASGFRDFSRIAGSHPEMWRDISLANKEALLTEVNRFQAELSTIQQLLEADDGEGLEALFKRASDARNAWAKKQ